MPVPVFVGEVNPYGGHPAMALYPYPERSTGYRLCHDILGIRRVDYIHCVRYNLCTRDWSLLSARATARALRDEYEGMEGAEKRVLVLLGAKVCKAFDVEYRPFTRTDDGRYVILPHPSGRCRTWNEEGSFERARALMRETFPLLRIGGASAVSNP